MNYHIRYLSNALPSVCYSLYKDAEQRITNFAVVERVRCAMESALLNAAIPQAEKESILPLAEPLLTPEMNAWHRMWILRALNQIPASERGNVIYYARQLCMPKMSGLAIYDILKNMAAIPQAERAKVTQIILRSMEAIPEAERENFIQDVLPLFTPAAENWDRSLLAEDENVLQHALPLFTRETTAFERSRILAAVALIPEPHRASGIQYARRLFTPSTDNALVCCPGLARASILRALNEIPEPHWAHVIQRALPLIRPEMKAEDITRILEIEAQREREFLAESLARLGS